MWLEIAFAAGILIPTFAAVGIYNVLARRRSEADNAWAQAEIELKRRGELIPRLIGAARECAPDDPALVGRIVRAHVTACSTCGIGDRIAAETQLGKVLEELAKLLEAKSGPDADGRLPALREELSSAEAGIAAARRRYNESAANCNTVLRSFPGIVFALVFGIRSAEVWRCDEDAAAPEAPKLKA